MHHVELLDAMDLAPEGSPIKSLPVAVLQVHQNDEDKESHRSGNNTLLVHPMRTLAPRPWQREAGNGTPKVNDTAKQVKQGRRIRVEVFLGGRSFRILLTRLSGAGFQLT